MNLLTDRSYGQWLRMKLITGLDFIPETFPSTNLGPTETTPRC